MKMKMLALLSLAFFPILHLLEKLKLILINILQALEH